MPKLRVLSAGQVCKILQAHGFTQSRKSGSHIVMRKQTSVGGRTVFIVDGDVDCGDEAAVLALLRRKYQLEHLQTFSMGAYSILAPVTANQLSGIENNAG